MPYLPNHKWEMFCRESVELTLAGDPKARIKAFERAGMGVAGSKSNASNARRLGNRPLIKARFSELFREACEYRDITAAKLVVRIDRVGRANFADFFEDDGVTLKNIKKLPRELTDAIESIKFVDDGTDESGERRLRAELKLFDKNAANFTMLKHYGGLPDPNPAPSGGVNNFFNVLSVDDQQVLLGMLEAVAGGQGGADRAVTIEHREGGAAP
jgi:hypothetical protein